EAQLDQATLGLVGDGVAVQLDDDREADARRRGSGRSRGGDDPLVGQWHTGGAQQFLRSGLAQRRHAFTCWTLYVSTDLATILPLVAPLASDSQNTTVRPRRMIHPSAIR